MECKKDLVYWKISLIFTKVYELRVYIFKTMKELMTYQPIQTLPGLGTEKLGCD